MEIKTQIEHSLDDITIVRVPLGPVSNLYAWEEVLCEEERIRSCRFIDVSAREAFIVMRGALRMRISNVLSCFPEDLRFSCNEYGKPNLIEPPSTIKFNVSHTSGLGLIAMHPSADVGIDVERIRPLNDLSSIVSHFCSISEQRSLEALPRDEFLVGFFRCWTRKEAILKMIGRGLSVDLRKFSVSTDKEARILDSDIEEVNRKCILQNLHVGDEYAACVAYRDN